MNLTRPSPRLVVSSLILLAGGAAVSSAVMTSGPNSAQFRLTDSGDRFAGAPPVTAPGATASPLDQVTWLCSEAEYQVATNTATAFMAYAAQDCAKVGSTGLLSTIPTAESSAPLGYLMCEYAKWQVAKGTASELDRSVASNCGLPMPPQPSGIQQNPSQPPVSFGIDAKNSWIGDVEGEAVIVWTGAQWSVLQDGSIGDPRLSEVYEFVQPSSSGPLKSSALFGGDHGALAISSAEGAVLQLQAADGTRFTFDMSAETLTSD
jgi:hypothetical protein